MTAPALKDYFDLAFLQQLAAEVRRQHPTFDENQLVTQLWDQTYQQQSLKQRVRRIAATLYQQLDLSFADSMALLKPVSSRFGGLQGFIFADMVEQFGLAHFDDAMQALAHFTCYSTGEFAIRPFLQRYPQQCLQQLRQWSTSDNYHLRRLASEGCRPRLPWGQQLPQFIQDPTPLLPILQQLNTDPEDYVRRSVANNLNDISKDHPELVLALARDWHGQHPHTDWILKHALRGLLKQGNSSALQLFDLAPRQLMASLQLETGQQHLGMPALHYGDTLPFAATLQLQDGPAPLRVEFAIRFAAKTGSRRPKVFQWLQREAGPGPLTLKKSYRFIDLTTRKHYAGEHQLQLIVNGQTLASCAFWLHRAND